MSTRGFKESVRDIGRIHIQNLRSFFCSFVVFSPTSYFLAIVVFLRCVLWFSKVVRLKVSYQILAALIGLSQNMQKQQNILNWEVYPVLFVFPCTYLFLSSRIRELNSIVDMLMLSLAFYGSEQFLELSI